MSLEADARAIRNRVVKNLNFGVARGLTATAKFASEKMQQQLSTIFDRPTPFTQRAIGFQSASKGKLEARVFVRDVQAQYLQMQETGGVRRRMPGKPITLAVGQRLNQYGNISRGAIARQRQRDDVFFASGRDSRTSHLPPGLYQRKKAGVRKRKGVKGKGQLKLLVAYEPEGKYKPRFRFQERVTKIAQAKLRANIETSIAEAMRTMR